MKLSPVAAPGSLAMEAAIKPNPTLHRAHNTTITNENNSPVSSA